MVADRTISVALRAQTDQYNRAMQQSGRQTAAAGTAAQGTQRAMGGLGMAARRLVPILGVAGLARSARQSVSAAVDLESRLFSMQTQIGLTAGEVGEFSDTFGRLGSTTGIAGQELADASWQIASAGLRGADALGTLEAAAKASAVGFGDVSTIAGLTGAAVNAYGSEVLSAAEATDVLAAAVRSGTAAPEEIAATMGAVLPIAAEMGVRFDEIGAAQAAMTRTGTDAATSVTQLRAILSLLLNPAQGSADAMAEVGLSAQGLRDTIRKDGLWEALMEMRTAVGDNEDVMGRMIPNVRALAGFLDLTGSNAEANAQVFADLADATGLVDDAHEQWGDTTEAQLAKASANWQNFKTNVADGAIPAVNAALDSMNAAFDRGNMLNDMSASGQLSGMDTFGAAFRGALGDFGGVDDILGQVRAFEELEARRADLRAEADRYVGSLVNTAREAGTTAGAIGDLGGEFADTADDTLSAADELENYLDALQRATDPVFNLMSAIQDVDAAQSDYNDAVEEFGAGSAEAQDAAISLAQRLVDVERAAIDGDLSFDEFDGKLAEWVRTGALTADQAIAIRDRVLEARQEAEKYEGNYNANVSVTGNAWQRIDALRAKINNLPSSNIVVEAMVGAPRMHTGGRVTASGQVERFHEGGHVGFGRLGSDEVPAILQTGEVVLSRAQVADMASAVNGGGSSLVGTMNVYGNDPRSTASEVTHQIRMNQLVGAY